MQSRLARFVSFAAIFVLTVNSPAIARESKVADAAKQRARAAVVALIKRGADVNAPQADGATALHWAAYWDDTAMAADLLAANAVPNAVNDYGVTPLTLAATNGSAEMMERLLKAGARPNTAMPSGETVLMTAARVGKPEPVALLLAHGADVNAKETLKGQTALMWAISERHLAVARLLIEKGADIHAVTTETGFTPLLFAARHGDLETIALLLERGATVDAPAKDGSTPLLVATVRGHTAAALYLLEKGAAADGNPEAGFTPLHWASGKWETQTTHDYPDAGGEWHALVGVRERQHDLIKALLARGADVNARTVKSPPRFGFGLAGNVKTTGASPFWIASMAADVPLMKLLLAHGADPRAKNVDDVTPLMVAAGVGRSPNDSLISEPDSLAATLLCLELGNEVNLQAAHNGYTALHGAAYYGLDAVVRTLVEHGADLDLKAKTGETPLDIADGTEQNMMFVSHASTAALLRTLAAAKAKP
jgi:ankyrin repeat protein